MKLTILKIDKPIYMGDFDKVYLPASEGDIEILPGHAPFMTSLKSGKVKYFFDGKEENIEIKSGFVEVNKLEVLVIL